MNSLHSVADWMQRMDPNGDYEDVTEQDIPILISILYRWRSELPEDSKLFQTCNKMINRLEELK